MENLKSYLDGELDIAQQAEVETHLRNDDELQRMVEEFSTISTTLKTADSGEPYGFEKLEERLKEAPKASIYEKKKIWRLATNWSASMACLALAAVILFPVFAQSKQSARKSAFRRESGSDATASTITPTKGESRANASQDLPQSGMERIKGRTESFDGLGVSPTDSSPPEQSKSDSEVIANGDAMAKSPAPEIPTEPSEADRLQNGSDVKVSKPSFESGAPTSQWYDKAKTENERTRTGFGKTLRPESQFKGEMRSLRDKTAQPVTTIGDTPHGIYLERAGQVQVKVDDLMRAVNEATGMVQSFHGFVTASDLQNQADGGSATMTIRVPTDSFNATLDKLQAMGEVLSVNSNSQDITSETVEHGAKMVSWADEEKRLIDELNKAKTNKQRLEIRDELRSVRANLEAYRASVKSLTERAKFSTINVSFVRGDKATKAGGTGNWSGDALKGAKDNLSSIGQVVGTMGIYFLVFAPIWLPFAIAAYVIRKKNS